MKNVLFFLLACWCITSAHAQKMQEWGWVPLDSTYLICQYEYRYYNPVAKTYQEENMLLEIGKSLSKFYSYDTFEFDSLATTPQGKDILNQRFEDCLRRSSKAPKKDKMKILLEIPSKESGHMIYKNYPETGQMLVQDMANSDYYKYTETFPSQEWTLQEDTLSILGYSCQKASCTWRGRDYVAWFTTEIPLADGPYKFCGLPGLIMKIEDKKHQFSYQIQGIRKGKQAIYLAKPVNTLGIEEYKESSREEVIRMHIKETKSMIRGLNRDMRRLGKTVRFSEKKLGILEQDITD